MAATIATCVGCGSEFVAARSHAQWCSERCRKATTRAATTWPASMTVLEEKVASRVHYDGIRPEDAVLFLVRRWPQSSKQVPA